MLVVPSRSVHLRRHFPSLLSYPPCLYHVLLFSPFFALCSLISSFLHYILWLEVQVDDVTVVQVFNLARNRIIWNVIVKI